jgi:hypothetical protein
MTSHPICSIGPYWNNEILKCVTGQWINTARNKKTPSSWTTVGSCSIFPQLSVLEDLLRPSYLSLQITECHTYPAPFYTTAPIPHAPTIAWQMEDFSTHGTSPCPQKYAPASALVRVCSLRYRMSSSELWTVTVRLNICLQRSSNNESLVMPVTDLYCMRNWMLCTA